MSLAAENFDYERYCPSCGKWDVSLVVDIGWCRNCVTKYLPDKLVCIRCNTSFDASGNGEYCSTCKRLNWIEENIDAIEEVMLTGKSATEAMLIVSAGNRARCVICGDSIKGGGAHEKMFCNKKPECREAQRQYKAIRGGRTRDEALRLVLERRSE